MRLTAPFQDSNVMARFTVILPEGTVLLKNEATGETLRLSADSGPLVLGEIDMTMTWSPKPLSVGPTTPDVASEPIQAKSDSSALLDSAFELKPEAPGIAPLTKPVPSPEGLQFSNPYDTIRAALPPGFGPNEGEPFMSPADPMDPEAIPSVRGIRVLDAPLEALTAEDFERTIEALALRRNNIEGEIEFLEEIEGDETDINELTADLTTIDQDIADVIARKEDFEALLKRQMEE